MSLFEELKRRNVLRTGAAYLAASWLLIQIVETLFPVFGLTDAAIRMVVLLLVIGFLPVLLISWFFRLTPEGLKRGSVTEGSAAVPGSKRAIDRAILIVLIIGISYFAFDKFVLTPERVADREAEAVVRAKAEAVSEYFDDRSLAVLPFLNLSDSPGQQHFVDGLTDEILNSLAGADGLQLISRTTSFAYRASSLPISEIAAELGVAYILEGSVRRTGEAIRVTAQLIDAKSDAHLWSRTYDDVVTTHNLFKVQESIAKRVSDALEVRLVPGGSHKAPNSIETLDLYYDGLALFRELQNGQEVSDERFSMAAAKFEGALEIEPDWLPALVKLGQLYHWWSFGRDQQKLETSLRYIQDVLSRDPQNIDAHAAMGYILWAKGDFRQSLDFYDKVYALGGDRGWGRAITLSSLGRFDEAVTAFRESLPIYPISLSLKTQLTHAMYCAGQYGDIVGQEDQLIAAWPDDQVGVKFFIAASHARLGNREDALELVDQLTQALQSETYFASILAAAGERERARNAIDVLEERDQALESAASAALQFGQTDRALNLLERLDQQLSVGNTGFLLCEPEIRGLAGNPRYDAMLDRRGLLPE